MSAPQPRPIRVLIVDDEALARATLRVLLAEDPTVTVVGECASAEEAREVLDTLAPDLVFLDVNMAEMDGFELLRDIGPGRAFEVIFVTAHDAHALRAFEVAALDYLLKPFDDDRFAAALARAKAHLQRGHVAELAQRLTAALTALPPAAPPPPSLQTPPAAADRIAVRDGARINLISVNDIDWIGADDYYVQIHAGGKTHLLRESLRSLESRLDPRSFARVHRSTIVNVTRIQEIQPAPNGESLIVLRDGTELRLSRRFRDALHALLGL